MPPNAIATESAAAGKILLRYRAVDSSMGVTRKTVLAVARQLGITETQLIHHALAEFVGRIIPQYESPDDEISSHQLKALDVISTKTEHDKSIGKLF